MLKSLTLFGALVLVLAGCAQLPPTPEDLQAKRFDPAPGKAVIYLVRSRPDIGDAPATLWLDDRMIGTTYEGTYARLEVAPGVHRIQGYGPDVGAIALDVAPDRMYFVRQTVAGGPRMSQARSTFTMADERWARSTVAYSVLVASLH